MATLRAVLRLLAIVACVLGVPAEAPKAIELASHDSIQVEVDRGLLSVTLGEAPLESVLEEIAREGGLRLKTRGELGMVRPQRFEGQPLAEGIQRVVGDNRVNLMLRYETAADGRHRLVGVGAYEAHEGSRPTPPARTHGDRAPSWRTAPRLPPPPAPG